MWKASASLLVFPSIQPAIGDMVPIGIPDDVRSDASTLIALYKRTDPVVEPKQKRKRSNKDPDDEADSGKRLKHDLRPRNAKSNSKSNAKGSSKSNAKGNSKGNSKSNAKGKADNANGKGSSKNTRYDGMADNYYWGPDMTAANVMSVVAGWRRSNERYEADKAERERMFAERERMVC